MNFPEPVIRLRSYRLLLIAVFLLIFNSLSAQDLALSDAEKIWIQQHPEFRIGISPDWPPFEFLDKKGDYQGFSAEIARIVTERLGIKLKIVAADLPWSEVLEMIRKSELDGLASVFISEKRKSFVNFSQAYVAVPHLVIVRKDHASFSSLSELGGKKLAYMRGWVCQEFIERDYPEIIISSNDKVEGLIGQVLLGTADAGLIDMASLSYYSRKHHLADLKVAFKTQYEPELSFGFPVEDKVGATLFNKVLSMITAEEMTALRNKWLTGADSPILQFRHFLLLLLAVFLIVLFITGWNIVLRKKIREHTSALESEMEQNRQHSQALAESEQKIRAFFNQTLQFIGLLSTDGVLLEANQSSLDRIDGKSVSVIGEKFWNTPWWNHSIELQNKLKRSVKKAAEGGLVRFETVHKDQAGNSYFVDFSLKPLKNTDGEIVNLIAEGRDVTSQHIAMKALRQSEERFRLLFESSPDACWLIQNDRFIECNVTAGILLGFDNKDDLLNLHPADISPEFQADGRSSFEAANEKMQEAYENGVARFKWLHKHSRGDIIHMEITLSMISFNDGPALYCIARDLTDQYLAEQERKKLEEQFIQAQKMESIGRLAGGVAHDFNNLLTAIRGFSELIAMEEGLPPRAAEMLKEIDRAGLSATELTRQLLAFSRKQVIEPRNIDVNKLVSDLQKMLQRLIGEDYFLKQSLCEEESICFADPGQLEQVLVNLVVNARDAMPGGGIVRMETAHVRIEKEADDASEKLSPGKYLMLAISDTGSGMTEEVKQRIFEPFFTTKDQGKGTGLGLATVYGIVRQSGGNIFVYSEPGKGTIFKIYFPLVEGEAEQHDLRAETFERGNNQLIMIVEDDELLRHLMICGLPEFGYRVMPFSSASDALDFIAQGDSEEVDLMVTDVIMPEIYGPELAERINQLRPALPVLYISGYTHDAIIDQGILRKDVKFLSKPFSMVGLAAKISSILAAES